MTKNQLERISRHFLGHLLSNPELREALNAAGGPGRGKPEDRIARLINKVVAPETKVTAKHVPAIANRIQELTEVKDGSDVFILANRANWGGGTGK